MQSGESIDSEEESEAFRTLCQHASGRFGALDPAGIVRVIRRASAGTDFSVQAAAMGAAIECYRAIKSDGVHVVQSPAGDEGVWHVGQQKAQVQHGEHVEHEEVFITSTEPIVLSCSCVDYARNSLGICVHGL